MTKYSYTDVEFLEISLTDDPADELATVTTYLNNKDDQNMIEEIKQQLADKEAEVLNLKAQLAQATKPIPVPVYTALSGKKYFDTDSEELIDMVKEKDALATAALNAEKETAIKTFKAQLSNLPAPDEVLTALSEQVVNIPNAEVREGVMQVLLSQNATLGEMYKEKGADVKEEISNDPEDLETAFEKEATALSNKENISIEKARVQLFMSPNKSKTVINYLKGTK
jgi:hypothetical protein